jgi:hypothetical protein
MPGLDELSLFAARFEAVGVPYMVTGATAAIFYGQPRVTNDLDVVVSLDEAGRFALLREFPEADFYVPPESVIRVEQARSQRGHFNIIHLESGFKADIYLAADDALHGWAMPRRRRVQWTSQLVVSFAPPEYVVLRKLEYFREGGSMKHAVDIRAMRDITSLDEASMVPWLERLGLMTVWQQVKSRN